MPATSGVAEMASAEMALQVASSSPRFCVGSPRTLVTDYATIVRLFGQSRPELLRPGRAYLGVLRGWQAHDAWDHVQAEKVTAHTGSTDTASAANS